MHWINSASPCCYHCWFPPPPAPPPKNFLLCVDFSDLIGTQFTFNCALGKMVEVQAWGRHCRRCNRNYTKLSFSSSSAYKTSKHISWLGKWPWVFNDHLWRAQGRCSWAVTASTTHTELLWQPPLPARPAPASFKLLSKPLKLTEDRIHQKSERFPSLARVVKAVCDARDGGSRGTTACGQQKSPHILTVFTPAFSVNRERWRNNTNVTHASQGIEVPHLPRDLFFHPCEQSPSKGQGH